MSEDLSKRAFDGVSAWLRANSFVVDMAQMATMVSLAEHLLTQAAPEAQAEPAGRQRAWHAQEDPKCLYDGKDACIDCLMQGECMARAPASGERDTLRALLREARHFVQLDRDSLWDTEVSPVTNTVSDEVKEWISDYDSLLGRIDAVLADGGAK